MGIMFYNAFVSTDHVLISTCVVYNDMYKWHNGWTVGPTSITENASVTVFYKPTIALHALVVAHIWKGRIM